MNFSNLSPYEFELLAKDVMSKRLKLPLRSFAAGKDGGIDVSDAGVEGKVLIQVKHYHKSPQSVLIRDLKKEVPKVKKCNPKNYYIFTSCALNPQGVMEIYELFKPYMSSSANIIAASEIEDFLNNDNNQEVLRKHFKLWLTSTNILDISLHNDVWFDSQDLLQKIQDNQGLYVETQFSRHVYDLLLKERVLMILGAPGIGKTTTSEMLVAKFAMQGYLVRYVSNAANLNEIKKTLTDPDAKEIILLDDCLGQCYFKMKEGQDKELTSLIHAVRKWPNKVLLLNSRITIYNEAKQQEMELVRSIENGKIGVETLEFKGLSLFEKAQILHNHLFLQNLPERYQQVVCENENYLKIIKHRNFTPRIIEFITRRAAVMQIPYTEYMGYVKEQLENPEKIWQNEFEQRLEKPDRILLTTLYSMTEGMVEERLLKECFNSRIEKSDVDTSVNQYENTMKRLLESFVSRIDKNGEVFISVANPSVNDFLGHYLRQNSLETKEIRATVQCVAQLFRVYHAERVWPWRNNDPEIKKTVEDAEILRYSYLSEENKSQIITAMVVAFKIKKPEYTSYVQRFCESPVSAVMCDFIFDAETTIVGLLTKDMISYYKIAPIVQKRENLESIVGEISLENMVTVLNNIEYLFCSPEEKERFLDAATHLLEDEIDEFMLMPADEILSDGNYIDSIRLGLSNEDEDDPEAITTVVEEAISQYMLDKQQQILDKLHDDLYIHLIENSTDCLARCDYQDDAREMVREYFNDSNDTFDAELHPENEEMTEIRHMFGD